MLCDSNIFKPLIFKPLTWSIRTQRYTNALARIQRDATSDIPFIFKGIRCCLVKNDPVSRATPLLLVPHEKFIQKPFYRVKRQTATAFRILITTPESIKICGDKFGTYYSLLHFARIYSLFRLRRIYKITKFSLGKNTTSS